MQRSVYLYKSFDKMDQSHIDDFYGCIADLLELDDIKKLAEYRHHISSTRLDHCIGVSYYSYIIAKKWDCDYVSAARGGLLHDLFFYDSKIYPASFHLLSHPRTALRNAERICDINDVERDIILKHMWPMTPGKPKYKESFIVAFVDDYCAVFEASTRLSERFLKSARQFIRWKQLRTLEYV